MVDRFEERHLTEPQEQDLNSREGQVDEPQPFGRFAESGRQSVRHRPWRLSPRELNRAHTEKGQNRNGQHDDPHPSDPLAQGTPEHDAMGQQARVRDDGCTRRGYTCCGLEDRIRQVPDLSGEQVRKGTGERQSDPCQANSCEALPGTEFARAVEDAPEDEPNERRYPASEEKPRKLRPFLIDRANKDRREHRDAGRAENRADDVQEVSPGHEVSPIASLRERSSLAS